MPRYYFHLRDAATAYLIRDTAGASLTDIAQARREAIDLAQDIVRHRLQVPTWQIVVTDGAANVVLARSAAQKD